MKKITRIIPLFVKDNMSSFSDARYEKGFTKDMLADASGISIDAVRKYERSIWLPKKKKTTTSSQKFLTGNYGIERSSSSWHSQRQLTGSNIHADVSLSS